MNRKETTATLGRLLEKHIDPQNDPRIYWAKEVTFDYSDGSTVRVDYMRFKPVKNTVSGIEKGDFYCYEIKSSIADYHSPNGHNFMGDYNYYVMPEEVFKAVEKEIPFHVGVLIPLDDWRGKTILVPAKNAKREDRNRPVCEMLLMMYRSSRREVVNVRRSAAKEGAEG